MANKNCLVYETLGKVSDLQLCEGAGKNEVRLSGVFGVCGVKNNNRRIYNKENYGMMVEALQKVISTEGCPGELEHPNTMNITLENVSHKIESIQMNEDGTITGTILLLNTPKGQIAKAIVEGGLPLYISSRGAGSIDESGNVTLTTIKTYDLVGTPGFSQAKLNLKENQTYESLNESVEDGNIMYAIVEDDSLDNLLKTDDKDKSDKEEKAENKDKDSKEEHKEKPAKKEETAEEPKEKPAKKEETAEEPKDDKTNKSKDIDMNDLKEAIDKLTEKVTNLEAELHIAQESLTTAEEKLAAIKETNYDAIEDWIKEEFSPEFKNSVIDEMAEYTQNWIVEEFSPEIQNWIVEEFSPEIQNWIVEEFSPEVQNWVNEEFNPEIKKWVNEEFAQNIQNWVCEEFAPEIQNWITEEFSPAIEGWIAEEFAPENNEALEAKINENVNAFMEAQKENKYDSIDKMLETLSSENLDKDKTIELLKEQQEKNNNFKGVYVVEHMPEELRPTWEMLSEERKNEIVRQSKMYDVTRNGVCESFWASVKLNPEVIVESKKEVNIANDYQQSILSQMFKMRH